MIVLVIYFGTGTNQKTDAFRSPPHASPVQKRLAEKVRIRPANNFRLGGNESSQRLDIAFFRRDYLFCCKDHCF